MLHQHDECPTSLLSLDAAQLPTRQDDFRIIIIRLCEAGKINGTVRRNDNGIVVVGARGRGGTHNVAAIR